MCYSAGWCLEACTEPTPSGHSLAAAGYRFRVLISYGEAWFAWYMRRLAERPANVLFVLKSVLR